MAMDNITLTSGMRQNLFSLQQTAKSMDLTQTRLSTGKRVNSALDDPIAFFAAQGHTQRAGDLAIRKDEMAEAIQTIKAADNGISAVLDLIASAKSTAQSAAANTSTTERGTLAATYNELMSQIVTLTEDSFYKGINLLGGPPTPSRSHLTKLVARQCRFPELTAQAVSATMLPLLGTPQQVMLATSPTTSPHSTSRVIRCELPRPHCPTS
jgi:flagellin-like hook-associated protein FlgL